MSGYVIQKLNPDDKIDFGDTKRPYRDEIIYLEFSHPILHGIVLHKFLVLSFTSKKNPWKPDFGVRSRCFRHVAPPQPLHTYCIPHFTHYWSLYQVLAYYVPQHRPRYRQVDPFFLTHMGWHLILRGIMPLQIYGNIEKWVRNTRHKRVGSVPTGPNWKRTMWPTIRPSGEE